MGQQNTTNRKITTIPDIVDNIIDSVIDNITGHQNSINNINNTNNTNNTNNIDNINHNVYNSVDHNDLDDWVHVFNEESIKSGSVVNKETDDTNVFTNKLYIYVLKCEHGKYYIGKSKNLDDRILEHFNDYGSVWTHIHKPIDIVEIIKNADSFDEDKYTKIYMSKFGIENVRGGSYAQITLDAETIRYLEKEIGSTYDNCYRCGRKGHFINKCYAMTHVDGKILSGAIHLNDNNDLKTSNVCYRCGRKGHLQKSCYAIKHAKGYFIK